MLKIAINKNVSYVLHAFVFFLEGETLKHIDTHTHAFKTTAREKNGKCIVTNTKRRLFRYIRDVCAVAMIFV